MDHFPGCYPPECVCFEARIPPKPRWLPGRTLLLAKVKYQKTPVRGVALAPIPYGESELEPFEGVETPHLRIDPLHVLLASLNEFWPHQLMWENQLLMCPEANHLTRHRGNLFSQELVSNLLSDCRISQSANQASFFLTAAEDIVTTGKLSLVVSGEATPERIEAVRAKALHLPLTPDYDLVGRIFNRLIDSFCY